MIGLGVRSGSVRVSFGSLRTVFALAPPPHPIHTTLRKEWVKPRRCLTRCWDGTRGSRLSGSRFQAAQPSSLWEPCASDAPSPAPAPHAVGCSVGQELEAIKRSAQGQRNTLSPTHGQAKWQGVGCKMRPLKIAIFQGGSVELAFIERGVCHHGDWQFGCLVEICAGYSPVIRPQRSCSHDS